MKASKNSLHISLQIYRDIINVSHPSDVEIDEAGCFQPFLQVVTHDRWLSLENRQRNGPKNGHSVKILVLIVDN